MTQTCHQTEPEDTRIPVDAEEIPEFADEAAEDAFWETHTLSERFWSKAGPIPEDELPIDHSRLPQATRREHS